VTIFDIVQKHPKRRPFHILKFIVNQAPIFLQQEQKFPAAEREAHFAEENPFDLRKVPDYDDCLFLCTLLDLYPIMLYLQLSDLALQLLLFALLLGFICYDQCGIDIDRFHVVNGLFFLGFERFDFYRELVGFADQKILVFGTDTHGSCHQEICFAVDLI
jgi:hypothetical protein